MTKIKLEELSEKSTPCEICVAMNNREVELNESRKYFDSDRCESGNAVLGYGSSCIDAHKARIKLLYLNSSL